MGVLLLALTGCGSSTVNVQTLLQDAKHSVDAAQSVHFVVTSQNASSTNTYLKSGEGSARRPDGFTGSLDVQLAGSGFVVTVKIASIGGKFYVQQPFSTTWEVTDPTKYGFGDPAKLIDPYNGLSTLIVAAKNPTLGDRDRLNGELLEEVHCTVSGADVARLLTSADPSRDDQAVIGIDADTHELRRVVITGPFFATGKDATYTLTLDNYGANVSITAPPVASP